MNYFVLFSVILIAASVIVLLIPPTTEGFTSATPNANMKPNANAKPKPSAPRPAAAGQRNLSSNAGTADGGSTNQHLMDDLLAQQDRFMEAFENRDKSNKATTVSSTTTKKKGVASTGAPIGGNVPIPKAGCNKDKCEIKDPMSAIDGNCVNPTLPNGEPDYSTKYCPAFQPKDTTIDDQECMTCGYYKYTADCLKYADPKDKTKCTLYGDYKYSNPPDGSATYYSGSMPPGTNGGDDGGDDGGDGPICSATTCGPKTVMVDGTKCIIPGCVSTDGGMMPYPDDFYGNRTTNPCYPIKDDKGGMTNGFMCPAITSGEIYDMGGGSSDLCYTTNGIVDNTKFLKIDKTCSNNKQKSNQNFTPGKDAPIDGNDMPPPINTKHRSASATTTHHSGAINVYHHSSKQNQGQCSGKGQGKSGKQGQYGNSNDPNTYVDPVGDTTVLGYL